MRRRRLLAEHEECPDVVVDFFHEGRVEEAIVDSVDSLLNRGLVGDLEAEVVAGKCDEDKDEK